MAALKIVLCFVGAFLVGCESAFVDNLHKCDINDGDCQKNVIQKVLQIIGTAGIQEGEVNIPPVDPMQLRNVNLNVLNLVNITLVDGELKGIKNCIVKKMTTSIEDEQASMELLCDITIKGHYKAFSDNPLIKNLLGGETVRGDGVAKVKIEKLKLIFNYYFKIERREGETYIKCKFDKTQYTYDIGGKMLFNADNIYIGKEEQSALVVRLLNDNWKVLMATAGRVFMDKAMEYVYIFTHSFFDNVPTKFYIQDVSKYVHN